MEAIQSMTGFGKGEASSDQYNVSVEVKSVNHRFKDLRFRMSSIFASAELDLRKKLDKFFKRGSFDIYISYKKSSEQNHFDKLDKDKISQFIKEITPLVDQENVQVKISPCDFLRSEFFIDQDLSKDNQLLELVKSAYVKALDELQQSRLTEGSKMAQAILGHKDKYEKCLHKITEHSETFEATVKERLLNRLEEYKSEIKVDNNRFMQEIIYYMEKLDIGEEISRIHSHLSKLSSLLTSKGEIGRQIDFLVQELNRETNTIGSKSANQEISDIVIQMKTELEKIREQGLNIE